MSNETQPEPKMVSVLSIDAWADGEDGWNWNMWTKVGSVDVTMCDKPEAEILAFMVAEGYCKEAALTGCYVEDDQYNMVICDKENHQPLYALCCAARPPDLQSIGSRGLAEAEVRTQIVLPQITGP